MRGHASCLGTVICESFAIEKLPVNSLIIREFGGNQERQICRQEGPFEEGFSNILVLCQGRVNAYCIFTMLFASPIGESLAAARLPRSPSPLVGEGQRTRTCNAPQSG